MANKAVLLDRDDTLIADPGYINHPDQVKLLEGVPETLTELRAMGYKLVAVTNQSGVARGLLTEETLNEIHVRLKSLLAEKGVCLDAIYYCPYHPEGVIPKYRKESDWRKPNPGMLLAAAEDMDIDLSQSWVIGNSSRDIEAGQRAGCRTILLESITHDKKLQPGQPQPDYCAVNIKEAVNIIKKHHRLAGEAAPQMLSVAASEPEPTPQTQLPPKTEAESEPREIKRQEPSEKSAADKTNGSNIEQLLSGILKELKNSHREEIFGEFSAMRMLAGIIQAIVLFCLLASVWLLMNPARQEISVLTALGFAIVFQLMSLTFYTMRGRK